MRDDEIESMTDAEAIASAMLVGGVFESNHARGGWCELGEEWTPFETSFIRTPRGATSPHWDCGSYTFTTQHGAAREYLRWRLTRRGNDGAQ